MATKTHTDSDMRTLVKGLKEGYEIRPDNAGHYKVVGPDGKLVRENGKPIVLPGTPGDRKAMANNRARFKRLGLLETGSGPKRSQRAHTARPDLKGLSREQQKEATAENLLKSNELLKDMEPWIKAIGGWDTKGVKADISAILVDLYPETYAASVNAATMLTGFTKGDAVTERHRAALHGLNEMFQAAPEPRALYVDLVRKAKGLSSSIGPVELAPGKEWPYEVELLRLDALFADESYQRPVHEPFVRQLVLTFDERLVGVIDVSRRSDGFAILDGQQRTETMRQVGKTTAWCAIYENMSIQAEAQFFFHKNKDRKGMSAYYGFRARALAGDETALAIEQILKESGYRLGPTTDQNEVIGSVRGIEDVYLFPSDVRENALPPTLKVMATAWRGRKGSTDTEIIRGLGRFFRVYGDDVIQWDHWVEALTALGPMLVIGRARDFSGATEQRGHGKSMAATLVEIHNTGLPSKDRLDIKAIEQDDESRRKKKRRGIL